MTAIDHALVAVADLGRAARELQARHGLVALEGGRHPGWGTANRIVPLGDGYLELVAVVDAAEASGSVFGRWVAQERAPAAQPLGWAVRTGDVGAVAGRLGLTVTPGSRTTPDGRVLRWRLAGVEQAAAEPSLPFFIEWGEGTPPPGRAATGDAGATLSRLELTGDPDRLATWLGGSRLPVAVHPGPPAVRSIVLAGPAGEVVIGTPDRA